MLFRSNRYPDCRFVVWDKPVLTACPKCAAPFVTEKITKRYGTILRCAREGCDWVFQPELADGSVLPLPERREGPPRRPMRTPKTPPPGKKIAAQARPATKPKPKPKPKAKPKSKTASPKAPAAKATAPARARAGRKQPADGEAP